MYLITASLLNSWNYLFKVSEKYYDDAFENFVRSLKRERIEANEYMIAGIQFEDDCIAGKINGISEIIKDGQYQVVVKEWVKIDNIDYLLYGRIDVLYKGVVYDIKRKWKYEVGSFLDSFQHHLYMQCVPEAKKFEYLIGVKNSARKEEITNDSFEIYYETYLREECREINNDIREFVSWLKEKDLYEIYEKNWKAYKEVKKYV